MFAFTTQMPLQGSDDPVELSSHPSTVERESGKPGAPVIHDVKRCSREIQHGGETATGRCRETPEDLHQDQQSPHDHVTEHHVEQQLFVRPAGAVTSTAQGRGVSGGQQALQGRPPVIHLLDDRPAIDVVFDHFLIIRPGSAAWGAFQERRADTCEGDLRS